MIALLLLSLSAHSAEIRVETYSRVLVQVNSVVRPLGDDNAAWSRDLRGGSHTVSILDARGRLLHEQRFEVNDTQRLRLAWIDETLVTTRIEATRGSSLGPGGQPLRSFTLDQAVTPNQPPPSLHRQPMAQPDFERLLGVLEATTSFNRDEAITDAARDNFFTITQMLQLLKTLQFASDQTRVAEVLVPRVVDPQNRFMLRNQFTFPNTERTILELFPAP